MKPIISNTRTLKRRIIDKFSDAVFYRSTFIHSRFPQRFNYFTVCLVHCLHEVSPGWAAKGKKIEIQVSRSPENAFSTLFLTTEA